MFLFSYCAWGMKIWKSRRKSNGTLVALLLPVLFALLLLPRLPANGQSNGQGSEPSEAQALERQGRLDEAVQAWRAVIQKDPKDASAFASLGVVLSRQQEYGEAAAAYRKA